MADLIKVTTQVTISLTETQREAYSREHGVDFVAIDIAGRLRPEMTEVLRQIPWLGKYAVVEISDPRPVYEHVEQVGCPDHPEGVRGDG